MRRDTLLFYANLFTVWLNRRQLESYQLLYFLVLICCFGWSFWRNSSLMHKQWEKEEKRGARSLWFTFLRTAALKQQYFQSSIVNPVECTTWALRKSSSLKCVWLQILWGTFNKVKVSSGSLCLWQSTYFVCLPWKLIWK